MPSPPRRQWAQTHGRAAWLDPNAETSPGQGWEMPRSSMGRDQHPASQSQCLPSRDTPCQKHIPARGCPAQQHIKAKVLHNQNLLDPIDSLPGLPHKGSHSHAGSCPPSQRESWDSPSSDRAAQGPGLAQTILTPPASALLRVLVQTLIPSQESSSSRSEAGAGQRWANPTQGMSPAQHFSCKKPPHPELRQQSSIWHLLRTETGL